MTYVSFPLGSVWPSEWPGQVPSRGAVNRRSPKRDLGEREWRRLIQDSLAVENEIRFRQRVSEHLSTFGMSKREQRTKLREAVDIYRKHRRGTGVLLLETGLRAPQTERKVDRTSRYTIQSTDSLFRSETLDSDDAEKAKIAQVAKQIRERVEAKEPVGLHPHKLHDLVQAHSSRHVAHAIRHARVELRHGLLRTKLSKADGADCADCADDTRLSNFEARQRIEATLMWAAALAKADEDPATLPSEPEQLPPTGKPSGTHNVTMGVSDMALPVGARKIWGKRVVEKQKDMKWHVVGHVAGLENPAKVPQLAAGALDREALLHLLQQLLRIRHAHPSTPSAAPSSAGTQED